MAATMTRSPHHSHQHHQATTTTKRPRSGEAERNDDYHNNYYSSERASQGLYFDYHDQQGMRVVTPATSRTSAMASAAAARPSRRASAAPVPFVESSAALAAGSDCRCCGCIAAAARAYNARHLQQPQHALVHQAYPRSAAAPPPQGASSFGCSTYNTTPTARRASDSQAGAYLEYERHYRQHHRLVEEAVRPSRRRVEQPQPQPQQLDEAVHYDDHDNYYHRDHQRDATSAETPRGAKRRRTEQLMAILSSTLDVSLEAGDDLQQWCNDDSDSDLNLPAFLSLSWASGVIQSSPATTTTPSSPSSSSSSSSPSSSSSSISSSLVASPHLVDSRSGSFSYSYQVVASPLPTLVCAGSPVSSPGLGFFAGETATAATGAARSSLGSAVATDHRLGASASSPVGGECAGLAAWRDADEVICCGKKYLY